MNCINISCDKQSAVGNMCVEHYSELSGGFAGNIQLGDFCDKGHKIIDDNVQPYERDGKNYIRCLECNRRSHSVRRMKMGDKCHRGHTVDGANVEWYTHSDGKKRFRCKECNLLMKAKRNEKYRTSPEYEAYRKMRSEREAVRKSESLKRAERYDKILAIEVTQGGGTYTGLNYLKLGKRAQRAWEPLEKAFDSSQGVCYKNPDSWIDYDEDKAPSPNRAYQMCKDCPLLVECGRFASAYKPAVGVWAGEVWKDGKVVGK